MKLLILIWGAMTLFSAAEEKPYLSPDPSIAKPAIEVLVQSHDVDSLMEVIEGSDFFQLQLDAISAIGVPSYGQAARMLRVLQSRNVEVLRGGTEDVIIDRDLKMALMNSVAGALKIRPPQDASISQVAAFVAEADGLIQERSSVHDSGEVDRPARRPDLSPGEPQSAAREGPAGKPAVLTPVKEPALASRSIIAMSIVAALGLLWWLLRGRK